jgi:hypothetical protein
MIDDVSVVVGQHTRVEALDVFMWEEWRPTGNSLRPAVNGVVGRLLGGLV